MTARTPTALAIVRGNPGRRPLNANEPKPPPASSARPPEHLSPAAKREWRRVAPVLLEVGLLTPLDLGHLIGYVSSMADARHFDAEIQAAGAGASIALREARRTALRDACRFGAALGMSPAARAGLDVSISPTTSSKRGVAAEGAGRDRFFS